MRAQQQAEAIARVGLVGDRYAAAAGFWQDERVSRDLTLVEAEVIEQVSAGSGISIEAGELRRNITTRGVRLNDLVGRTFWLGEVLCKGTGLCEPCRHLEEVTRKALLRPLVHRGGLRAEVLAGGTIHVGDVLELADASAADGRLRRSRLQLGEHLAR
jgi:MOSC domain-containing protein YiiM